MKCPQCGARMVCRACATAVAGHQESAITPPDSLPRGSAPPERDPQQTFLVVARKHTDLLAQLQAVVGDFGWVRVIEDRRGNPSLLPREGREGGPMSLDEEPSP